MEELVAIFLLDNIEFNLIFNPNDAKQINSFDKIIELDENDYHFTLFFGIDEDTNIICETPCVIDYIDNNGLYGNVSDFDIITYSKFCKLKLLTSFH